MALPDWYHSDIGRRVFVPSERFVVEGPYGPSVFWADRPRLMCWGDLDDESVWWDAVEPYPCEREMAYGDL